MTGRRAAERRQLLLDLGPVAVPLGLVGEGVLVHRDVVHRVAAAAAGAGDALHRRRSTTSASRPCSASGASAEHARGRVAAGVGDQLGLAQLARGRARSARRPPSPKQLGSTVRRRTSARRCGRSRSRKSAERSTTRTPSAAQRRNGRRRGAVRVGDDRGVDALEPVEVELGQLERHPVARVEAVEPLAGVAARGRPRPARSRGWRQTICAARAPVKPEAPATSTRAAGSPSSGCASRSFTQRPPDRVQLRLDRARAAARPPRR